MIFACCAAVIWLFSRVLSAHSCARAVLRAGARCLGNVCSRSCGGRAKLVSVFASCSACVRPVLSRDCQQQQSLRDRCGIVAAAAAAQWCGCRSCSCPPARAAAALCELCDCLLTVLCVRPGALDDGKEDAIVRQFSIPLKFVCFCPFKGTIGLYHQRHTTLVRATTGH